MNTLRHIFYKYPVISNVHRTFCAISIKNNPGEEPDKLYKFVELELKGNDPAVLKSFCKFAVTTGNHLDIPVKSWNLRKPNHERYTVLKSVHIYKKHRVQYEHRTYYSFVQYKHLTGSTADTVLEYIERNLPEGVALKATKVEIQPIPEFLIPPETFKESPKSA
ncbi:28S ribosomal protein S10, mitochondrial [Diorhabda carinulata]|uniref:28S ribosomal protein S10, mitochondrial n=1 Tax=Diorhabda carinulata TaxID=1163345 RepID=UPI0025A2CCB6|nr:28S ribosomal protein S10, mitochondrial [Diorhabda carinulata]